MTQYMFFEKPAACVFIVCTDRNYKTMSIAATFALKKTLKFSPQSFCKVTCTIEGMQKIVELSLTSIMMHMYDEYKHFNLKQCSTFHRVQHISQGECFKS